jgi:5-(carboxyamino)imidazole ribonucleotide synthase
MTARVGVIGGGQLARMMIPPAVEMGIDLHVLAESEGSSAQLVASAVGDYTNIDVIRSFAQDLDVVTFDHEHVPLEVLDSMVELGVAVRPGPHSLVNAQDKSVMRERLSQIGAPIPRWTVATSAQEVDSFLNVLGADAVVAKTPRGGYDGKGVRVFSESSQLEDWLALGPVLLEEKVEFVKEVAQLVARRPTGDIAAWPLVETRQKNGVCAEVVAPAPGGPELHARAEKIAREIAQALDVSGVLAVEMFVLHDGRLLVNELAMRPHNSGHIFTELSKTSQFEQHLRAVLDWPLGDTNFVQECGVMVNIFGGIEHDALASVLKKHSGLKVHDYGKADRPGRKVGHLSMTGDDSSELSAALQEALSLVARDAQ